MKILFYGVKAKNMSKLWLSCPKTQRQSDDLDFGRDKFYYLYWS